MSCQVSGAGVNDGNCAVGADPFLGHHHGNRLADDVGAADYYDFCAFSFCTGADDQLLNACRGAG